MSLIRSNLFWAVVALIFCCLAPLAVYHFGYKQGMVDRKLKGGNAPGGYYVGEEAYKRGLLIVIIGGILCAFNLFAVLSYFWIKYIWPYVK